MKTKIDYNSTANQKIKGDFVAREVKACFSYEMEAILSVSSEIKYTKNSLELPTYDEIENLYLPTCSNCGFQGDFKVPDNGETFFCPDCGNVTTEEPETEPQEIFEWWIVTEFLYNKLRKHNEPVLEFGNNFYWGRTCTGQAILLDSVISSICEELEILDGQRFSWAKTN